MFFVLLEFFEALCKVPFRHWAPSWHKRQPLSTQVWACKGSEIHFHYGSLLFKKNSAMVLAWQRPQGCASLGKDSNRHESYDAWMLDGDSHALDSWAKSWEGRHENSWPNDIQDVLTPGYETLKFLDRKYPDSNCTTETCIFIRFRFDTYDTHIQ